MSGPDDAQARVARLIALLAQPGDARHADIARELDAIGVTSVDAITLAALQPPAPLDTPAARQAFQVTCANALAHIGTPDSQTALWRLFDSGDAPLHAAANRALAAWPVGFFFL